MKDDARAAEGARRRPADADRRAARASTTTRSTTSRSTSPSSPASSLQDELPAQVPVPVARRAGARLRRPDLASRSTSALKKAGYQPTDVDRAGRRRVRPTTRYLRGKDGTAQLTVDSLGRPKGARDAVDVSPQPGRHAAADDRHRPAARRRAGARVRDPASRTRGVEGAHADGGAIVALDPRNGAILAMASNPTYQPSVYVGPRPEEARAGARTEARRGARTTRASTARSTPPIRRARR